MYVFSGLDVVCFFRGVWSPGVFSSMLLLCSANLGAPWPIAFRLRGQDPLLILALGDLQWARGTFLSVSFSPPPWSGSLVPRLWKGIPPTPLLLIARPSRLLRGSGGWLVGRRGAVGISFLPLVGRLVPLSPAGVLLFFSLCCLLCVVCALITYVCCWHVLFVVCFVFLSFVGVRMQDPGF